MGLAPVPSNPERVGTTYERLSAPDRPGNRGPLRFEEGLATDTDLPDSFTRGMREGAIPAPGASNHVNPDVLFKHADETMRERSHVGSAAWVDAPPLLGAFAEAAGGDHELQYVQVKRSGGRQERGNPARVTD
jgi:hypothetical protein